MLQRWATGSVRVTDLARDLGVAHSRVQHLLTRTALKMFLPCLEDLPRWSQARRNGLTDEAIAQLSGTSSTVVTLALDGWPKTPRVRADEVVAAHQLWREGAPRAEVAQALGMPLTLLRKQLLAGESGLWPHRLTTAGLRERYGWTPSAVSLYRTKDILPPADGVEGKRSWWWETTIDHWEQQRELYWCRHCLHAFVSPIGLREHRTRVHP